MLAAAGVASRRACETLIAEGQVQVNGKVIRELGTKVDPDADEIRVNGERLVVAAKRKPLYIMLNKPVGFTSTVSDPHAEHTVIELLAQIEERVYPVGRLDIDSEGLLLLTNDGEFANRLTHPRYHVPKLYRVRARGFITRAAATKLAEGVELEDGKSAPAEVRYVEYDAGSLSTIVEITLFEGRNRQVRRMFDAVGNPVRQLTRIGFGSLRLAGLNSGTWRKLRPEEVEALLELAKPTPTPPKTDRRAKPMGPYRPPYLRLPQNAPQDAPRDQAENRADNKFENKFESKAEFKPEHKVEGKSEGKFENRFENKFDGPPRPWEANRSVKPGKRPTKPSDPRYVAPESDERNVASKPEGKLAGKFEGRAIGKEDGEQDAGASRFSRPYIAPKPRNKTPHKTGNGRPGDRPQYGGSSTSSFSSSNSRPNGRRSNDARQFEDDDYSPTEPSSMPARAATPYEKKIAKLTKGKGKDKPAGFTPGYPPDNGPARPNSSAGNAGRLPGSRPGSPPGRKFTPKSPPTASADGSNNNAAGRKAGLPYVPRPKPGFNKFGRAKP